MKRFFRFWFTLGPYSQARAIFTYASNLAEATEKITDRIQREYGSEGSLINRLEEFGLAECNQYTRTSVALSQCLLPSDVMAVNADLDQLDQSTLDPAERRAAKDFRQQLGAIRLRERQPLVTH